MGFGQAISSGFSNYVNFFGRACRSEYWFWVLFPIIAQIATGIIDTVIGMDVTTALFGLATFLPSLAVGIRRLHDIDRTGSWIFIWFIPIVGWIILIIWYCTKGTDGPNRFASSRLRGGRTMRPRFSMSSNIQMSNASRRC